MTLLQKIWKPKAIPRSRWEEFARGGRSKLFFDKKTSSPQITRAAVSGSVIAAVGHSPSGFSFFTKFFPSSQNPAADHKCATICSIQHEALLYTKTLTRILATSRIHCPLPCGCNYSTIDVAAVLRRSILSRLSEAGLFLITGQQRLGGACSQNEKTTVPKQVLQHFEISGPEHVGNDCRWCNKQTQMDTDGVVYVESCKCKPRVLTSRDSCTLAVNGVDGYGEGHEESEVEEYGLGNDIHAQCMILENKVTMQSCLDAREVSRASIAHYSYDPVSLLLGVEDLYGSFAEKESPRLEFSGCHDLQYSGDPSMNLDTEGVQHRNLRLLSGACCLPHPKKVKTGGEDAYFICSEEQVLGVADGVGGWADVGVDAGDYARELMLQSKLAVAQEPHGYVDPARVMIQAHARTKFRGSSTACILALSNHGLQAANLGDSGFVVMRNGRIIFKSPVQQHQFNIPFQLESGGSDPPTAAEVFSLQVAAGDVLVAGTDGLFDNLYDSELMGIVIRSTRAGLDPQMTAHNIAALARERAEDRDRQTPFSTAAQEAGFRFYGGKMDDITVIVSSVTTFKPSSSISLPKL